MIGERIHNYEINAHLGQGGMGNVYRATDIMLGREVALKMLHPQLTMQPQFLERFKKEARVLAQLLHPNIAVIYNFIEQGGNHFMVMEYVEGTSLDESLKTYRTLPAEFIVPVFLQALEGLQHAHRKNIFHRDIKPSNLMLTPDGILKLMDFGIAKVAGEQKMTQVNKIVGTIEFMAPELIEGKDASVASDIYSMGATLYELLSGQLPFVSDTDFNLMQAILKKKIIAPEKINPSIPKKLSDIIVKAMEKNPANRFQDARSFQQALVTAFPDYREINLKNLKKPTEINSISVNASAATRPNDRQEETVETRTKKSRSFALLETYWDKFLSNRRNVFIAAGILLMLVFGSIYLSTNDSSVDKDQQLQQSTDNASADKKNKSGNNETGVQSGGSIEQPTQVQPVNDQTGVIVSPSTEEEPIAVSKKEAPKKKSKSEITEPVTNYVEKTVENKPVPVTVEKKDIYIRDSKVEVSLSLRSTPDMNQRQKEAQRVSFYVTRAVVYDGVTIIRQGATASGTLTIGRVMTDIEIDNVEAANGKRISLRAAKTHGKRADIESNNYYTAYIQQGTRISF